MKKIVTIIAIITSALSFSQNWQAKEIKFNGVPGVFVPFDIMDEISLKLIDRKRLITENKSLTELENVFKDKIVTLTEKNYLTSETALKWQILHEKEVKKNSLLNENIKDYKTINVNTKRNARRNGFYLFGAGVSVGIITTLLILK